jgi:O-antigen/teichoic acid export membrane protein
MSRKKSAFLGFLYDLGGTSVLQIVTFVATPLYLNYTSGEVYGYWLTIGSVLSWLYLSDFGIGMALSRSAITAIEAKDKDLFNELIRGALILFSFTAIIFLIVGICLSGFFINWFNIKPEYLNSFRFTYFVTIAAGALAFPLSVFSASIEAFQKISFNRMVTSGSALLGIAIVLILLHLDFGLVAFSLGMFITVFSGAFVSFFYFRKLCPDFKLLPLKLTKTVIGKLVKFGGYFQIGKLANIVALNTDNIIIASFLGATLVSSYTFTSKLALLFSVTLISKIPLALFPGISQLVDQKNSEALKKNFISLFRIVMRIGIVSSLFVFIVNEKFISAWVGSDSYAGDLLSFVWIYMIFFDSIIRGVSIFIFSFGDLKGWAIASLAETILNISMSLLLIDKLGLVGVAVGTAISKTITTGIYTPLFLRKKLGLNISEVTRDVVLPTILRSLPGVFVLLIISRINFDVNEWVWMSCIGILTLLGNFLFFEFPFLLRLNQSSLKDKILALKSFY